MALLKLQCPRCGSDNLKTSGLTDQTNGQSIVQRYKCKNKECATKNGWHGTRPINIEIFEQFPERFTDDAAEALPQKEIKARIRELNAYKRENDVRTFVITAAQNATPIHENFWANLLHLCEQENGEPIVIPYRYTNPTSHWGQNARTNDWWSKEIISYCVNHRFQLNARVEVMADQKKSPTAVDPLSSLESHTGAKWGIVGSPKMRLKCIANGADSMSKILTTTGACTLPNYTPTTAGDKGKFHHVFGACLVQTKGAKAFIYQIIADDEGNFIHKDTEYRDGAAYQAPAALAFMMGDIHADWVDPGATKATFGDGGMVPLLRPLELVWQDVNDFYAGSHHHEKPEMFFTRLVKHNAGRSDIRAELERSFGYVNEHAPDYCRNIFPWSNHGNEHLWKWLNSKDPREDYVNFQFWLDTWQEIMKTAKLGDHGAESVDPYAYWGSQMLEDPDRATFCNSIDPYRIAEVDIVHGHMGPNGARGSTKNLARASEKVMSGHGHSPEIFEGHTRVGKMARRMEYERGPSSGALCNGVIYANGKRALYFIDGTEWQF